MTTEHFLWRVRLQRTILIAIFVVITLLLSPTTSGAQTQDSYHATFSYDCCSASFINTMRHPGEVLRLRWIPSASASNIGSKGFLDYSDRVGTT